MKFRTLLTVFGGALLAASLNASADLLSLTGGTPGFIPAGAATNDLLVPIYGSSDPRNGYYGAQINLTEAAPVTFTFLGREASYINLFQIDLGTGWTTIFNNQTSLVGATATYNLSAGLIPFRYTVTDYNPDAYATNGTNPMNNTASPDVNFFTSFDVANSVAGTTTTGNSLVTFLDDGGAGADDNHDDMAVRISAVPIPAAAWLFGSALLGLAGVGRRKLTGAEV